MSFKQIGYLDPTEFKKYIDATKNFEVIVHKYGNSLPLPTYPCWMEYRNEGGMSGSISFSRNTNKHILLNEMIGKIVDFLTPIFPENSPPNPARIHFMKTVGSIVPHRDEAGRLSCINIGIQNSSSAITQVSNDNIRKTFEQNHTNHTVQDGYAYLLNTSIIHAVIGTDQERYLITYGFEIPYDEMLARIRIN